MTTYPKKPRWPSALLFVAVLMVASCTATSDGGEVITRGTEGRNRLGSEKSPYLLQHADNPVHWYPWGEEAFAAARKQNKPIFMSIGYSTCHWCHVMEHESFENDSIAALMNRLFINIKVDREERPDVDHIYMRALRALTQGRGGWPLSMWLTPELKPFFGGTYYPPQDRYGRAGFPKVLQQMADAYRNQGSEIDRISTNVVNYLQQSPVPHAEVPPESLLRKAYDQNRGSFDRSWGGFGGAPKFPRSMSLSFLMRYYKRDGNAKAMEMVTKTLDKMAEGGMHDHLGGGFHRYSTDARWLVPHFEKMLYDNALLARTYLEAYQITQNERYAEVARDIFRYLLRDMRDPGGGLYAAEDADSEGEEGVFYVWTPDEIVQLLGSDAPAFTDYYQVTDGGNFEGHNILWTPTDLNETATRHDIEPGVLKAQLARNRGVLLEHRSKRIRPHRDEKILASWNGLALGALAYGYQVLGDEAYRDAARGIADYLLNEMWDGKTLKARSADGDVRYDGYLDDYAFVAWGLFDLYEATFEARYLKSAFALLDAAEEKFATPDGGYYFAPAANSELVARTQEINGGPIPSGISVMALNHLKRTEYTGDLSFKDRAIKLLKTYRSSVEQGPSGFPQLLCALDFLYGEPREIVIAGSLEDAADLVWAVRKDFTPNKVVLLNLPNTDEIQKLAPITIGKIAPAGEALAYVCQNFTCKLPTNDPKEMLEQIR